MRIMKLAVVAGILSIVAPVVAQDCSIQFGPSDDEQSHEVHQGRAGIVVIQAEDFAWRKDILCDRVLQRWTVVDPDTALPDGEPVIAGSTGEGYLQLLPDVLLASPWGGSLADPFQDACLRPTVSYFFQVPEAGTYQAYLRWEAHDIESDSVMVGVAELADGPGGDHADWYRLGCEGVGDADFGTQPWGTPPGFGAFESMTACGNPDAMVWELEAGTVYQLQIIARESGAAIDAITLRLAGSHLEPLPSSEDLEDLSEFDPEMLFVRELDPFPCPPPGNDCDEPIELELEAPQEITTEGATLGAVVPGCADAPGAFVHLRHAATETGEVRCTLSPPAIGTSVTIAAFDDCPSEGGQLLRCDEFVGGGPAPRQDVPVPPGGVVHFCIGSSGTPPYRGVVTLSQPVGQRFRRGNTNHDLGADISDAVAIFAHLFLGGPAFRCRDSADVNDDGQIDISDGIRLLRHLFLGVSPPPAPGLSECGEDPTEDSLDCEVAPDACL